MQALLQPAILCDMLVAHFERCPDPVRLDGTRSCCGCPKTAGVAPCCVSLAAELPQLLPEEWCNMILPRRGGPHADAKPSMAFLLAAGLLVLEKSDRLISKGKAKAPGTLLGWHKRAVPLTLPAAPEAGGDARADARARRLRRRSTPCGRPRERGRCSQRLRRRLSTPPASGCPTSAGWRLPRRSPSPAGHPTA